MVELMQGTLFEHREEGRAARGAKPKETKVRYPWWVPEAAAVSSGSIASAEGDMVSLTRGRVAGVERFASGASAYWDFRGYALAGVPVGVTATELNARTEAEVVRYSNRGGRVMIDSGAFGAFRAGKEIDFDKILSLYERLADATAQPKCLALVMPDVVGDQGATLGLQRQYRDRIIGLMDTGVEAIFPIQSPDLDPVGAYRAVEGLVGGRNFCAGIPSNEKAFSPAQVIDFAAKTQAKRLHLLGLAKPAVVGMLAREIECVSTGTELACDSCQLLAHVGRGRRLTDRATTRMASAMEAVERGEYEEHLPSMRMYLFALEWDAGFLTEEEAASLGRALGCEGKTWEVAFKAASRSGMLEVLGPLDPDEEFLAEKLWEVVPELLYRPWLRSVLSGPIRAFEVARLAGAQGLEDFENVARFGR